MLGYPVSPPSNLAAVLAAGNYADGADVYMSDGTGVDGGSIWMDQGTINFPGLGGDYGIYGSGSQIQTGSFNNSRGADGGVSLMCSAGYELNWQGGGLANTYDSGDTFTDIVMVGSTGFAMNGGIVSQSSGHALARFNGASDANWEMGLNCAEMDCATIGGSTALQIVVGTGSGGPDGFALGQAGGGESILEARGYDGQLYIRNNTVMGGSLAFGNAYMGSDGDSGWNVIDNGGNVLNWNQWDNNGLSVGGNLYMGLNAASAVGNVYLNGAAINGGSGATLQDDGSGHWTSVVTNDLQLANNGALLDFNYVFGGSSGRLNVEAPGCFFNVQANNSDNAAIQISGNNGGNSWILQAFNNDSSHSLIFYDNNSSATIMSIAADGLSLLGNNLNLGDGSGSGGGTLNLDGGQQNFGSGGYLQDNGGGGVNIQIASAGTISFDAAGSNLFNFFTCTGGGDTGFVLEGDGGNQWLLASLGASGHGSQGGSLWFIQGSTLSLALDGSTGYVGVGNSFQSSSPQELLDLGGNGNFAMNGGTGSGGGTFKLDSATINVDGTHTGFSGTCGPTQTATFINGICTGVA